MPIYEFRCKQCHQTATFFVRTVNDPLHPICPDCGSEKLERCISRFGISKTTRDVWEQSGEATMFPRDPNYYRDPRNIGRYTEKRLKELGIDMNSEEYRDTFAGVKETIEAAREGEMPKTLKDQL